ncbi:MAG: xanthine dehydrogenase family protein molybdopterin-binding subunit [Defluviitaleaceae bacterium]|nr:xanthine dehydrogenase family protein molybdopterin-binding subunit [Defluviitaleaceae bacterium]
MKPISKSIPKRDHLTKANGSAMYVCDYPTEDVLFGKLLRSGVPKANILNVKLPGLPEGYHYIDKNDVPGTNQVAIVLKDTPVFAESTVEHIGDPIGMIVGPNEHEVNRLLNETKIEYKELEPVFDVKKSDVVFFDYNYEKGDIEKAFIEADKIFEEEFETGLQEHMYLETNGLIADYSNGKIHIHGSIQCPYFVHDAVVHAMGIKHEDVSVAQDTMGGGFGGKEDHPSVMACQAAVAAYKLKKSVRIIYDRKEDVEATSKRHPSFCHYKVAVKDNHITGMQINVLYDAGAYTTLSPVVLQRGIIGACGIYNVPNLKVHGQARKTNTVPSGAFRGFGAPQTFFAVEMMMTHIAKDLGIDPVEFKLKHVSKQGELTSTSGKFHEPVPIPSMIDRVIKASDYYKKKEKYEKSTRLKSTHTKRYRRGIGLSAVYHGGGFTGNGERDLIKAVVKLKKDPIGNVEILTAITDMGQGINTVFAKIVSQELNLPIDRIIINYPDTSKVPNSGPTVASRSVMIVGELLRKAAAKLKEDWIDGREQIIEEHYKHPEFLIPFDLSTFYGDAYPSYSWAVNAVEVEIDTYTGCIDVIGAWGSFDVGTPIDENIVIGQMEGGFLQSIGYGMMEKMTAVNGRIRNNTFSDYIIPTAVDVPNMHVMLHVEDYSHGPYGAKGAGELPHVGGAPAVIDAIQNALGVTLNKTPFLAEDVMDVLRRQKSNG